MSTQNWRPWPWDKVPEWVPVVLGVTILVTAAPLLVTCIVTLTGIHMLAKLALEKMGIRLTLGRIPQWYADRMLVDPRNASYLPYIFFLCVWPATLFFWSMYRSIHYGWDWQWWLGIHFIHMGPRFGFFSAAQVLVHKEGHDHKGFFKGPWRILNYACQWWIGPFYGQVPMFYAMSHTKQHHQYDGGPLDTLTSWDMDRTKPINYIKYVPRFLLSWSGFAPVECFLRFGEYKLACKLIAGMTWYYAVMVGLLWWNWRFAVAHWIIPHLEVIVFLSAIAYLWHAFVDPDDVSNPYASSITVLNGRDNIWNEDYHVVHHGAPHVHWTDYPKHYEQHKDQYALRQATIFSDTEEGEIFSWLVFCRWRVLAEHFVDLNNKLTVEEKEELILKRLRFIAPFDPETKKKS